MSTVGGYHSYNLLAIWLETTLAHFCEMSPALIDILPSNIHNTPTHIAVEARSKRYFEPSRGKIFHAIDKDTHPK